MRLRIEMLQSWQEVLAKTQVPEQALSKVWRQKVAAIKGTQRWNKVAGPMGAVIATLGDLGWKPTSPWSWELSPGVSLELGGGIGGAKWEIGRQVQKVVEEQLWKQASLQYLGTGIGSCGDLTAARKIKKELEKEEDHRG